MFCEVGINSVGSNSPTTFLRASSLTIYSYSKPGPTGHRREDILRKPVRRRTRWSVSRPRRERVTTWRNCTSTALLFFLSLSNTNRLKDLDKEDDLPETLIQASMKEVRELKAKEEEERKRKDKKSVGKLQTHGFEPEHSGEVLF